MYERYVTSRPKYNDRIIAINVYAEYERPDWRYINQAWKEEVRAWEQAGMSRKKRDEKISEDRSYNQQLMDDARRTNHERWVMAARHLKGIRSPKYLLKQKARLEQQLADIESMLGSANEGIEEASS